MEDLSISVNNFVIESDSDSDSDSDMSELTEKMSPIVDNYRYIVLSVDIGVINLGISVSTLDENFNLIEIVWIDLINITRFICKSEEKCELYHTKTFCDWLNHVFQENRFFEEADFILVERQPPMGFLAIEQLIFSRWRSKAILISPNSMHKFFGIGNFDYDGRKEKTEKIAREKIKDKALIEQLNYYHRCHDIADSICLMLYWISKKQEECESAQRKQLFLQREIHLQNNRKTMSMNEWFECHRYIPRS